MAAEEVLVIGANGRMGRWAVEAFLERGWIVRAYVRAGSAHRVRDGILVIEGDAFDGDAVAKAADGVNVIVNAVNPPYDRWETDVPTITQSVLGAARSSGATVIVPGNVYNYGAGMPESLREDTPHDPTTKKGSLREQMETDYRAAVDEGVQTLVVRAGDFIERQETGNWFDTYVANKVDCGKVTYPGPMDRVHSWAYLPDLARAMAMLAERRNELAGFETFGFPGFSVTGKELVDAIEEATGRTMRVRGFPWPAVRLLGLFNKQMREVVEMRYLWSVPHGIDGTKMQAALPDFQPNDLQDALREALGVS
ncbi:MAG: NAD(P)H-binding protein [Myxococcota bacterium]